MAEKEPEARTTILSLPTAKLGEAKEGFEAVQSFLERFGYIDAEQRPALSAGRLDGGTSSALALYQQFHGLEPSGLFDESTREMMSRSRC